MWQKVPTVFTRVFAVLAQLPDVSHFGSVAHQRSVFYHCWFIGTAFGAQALPMLPVPQQQEEQRGFTLFEQRQGERGRRDSKLESLGHLALGELSFRFSSNMNSFMLH